MCNWGPRLLPLNVHMNLPEKEFKFQDEPEFSIFNCQKQNKTKSGYFSKMSRPPTLQGYKTSGHCKRKCVFDYYLWLQGSKLNQGQIAILGRNLIILREPLAPPPQKNHLSETWFTVSQEMETYTDGTPPSQKYHLTEIEKSRDWEGEPERQNLFRPGTHIIVTLVQNTSTPIENTQAVDIASALPLCELFQHSSSASGTT